jgi:hypothetical protein
MGKKIKISRFSLLGFFVAGSISTLLLTSCGVEQKIIDNLVDRGDGNYFAKAKNNDDLSVTLKEEIIKAFNDKTSTGTFKTSVVNKLLYE